MKELLITVICIASTSFFELNAQSQPTYRLGVRGGLNLSRFLERGTENRLLPSYQFGLSLEQRFNYQIGLSYDLLYSRQGNISYFTNPSLYDRVRTKLDYLILPISMHYTLSNTPFIANVGIQLGYLLNNQVDFLPKNGYTNNQNPSLQRIDWGLSLGPSLRIGKHTFIEIKYYQSLRSSVKSFIGVDPMTGMITTKPSPGRYNQLISANLTYYFLD